MADAGTPGSTADFSGSANGANKAAKDKACPFCAQQFTSSSLGRHLDLYIKEKNPKAADGVHDVAEIRKLRGGITRRQPRTSTSRREGSTPAAMERRSPGLEWRTGNDSPSLRRESMGDVGGFEHSKGKAGFFINKGTWESTGVMNHIPPPRASDARSWDGEERDANARREPRSRSVSKQMLAKTTFEQKQKMIDALDNAKAAELALRELLGSIRAAKQRIDGPSIFDYDPLKLDFPSLVLQCLPPPPTLYQSTTVPTTSSWSIHPPGETQYHALVDHFSAAFQSWRTSVRTATNITADDLSYTLRPQPSTFGVEGPADIKQRVENAAAALETKISTHLHNVFGHWTALPMPRRSEIWTLELARGVGRKSEELDKIKKERDFLRQEKAHLKQQVEELSCLQHPREFKLSGPSTFPFDAPLLGMLTDELATGSLARSKLLDSSMPLDAVIERAIGRWKGVVREARGNGNGLVTQRSLSAGSSHSGSFPPQAQAQQQKQSHELSRNSNQNPSQDQNQNNKSGQNHNPNQKQSQPPQVTSPHMTLPPTIVMDSNMSCSDADADADADMEDDDSFADMNDMPRASETQMTNGSTNTGAGFRVGDGNGNGNGQQRMGSGMEGLENQVSQGY
ncbi:hypothetical protein BUE80_DR001310, partial [Diplocarpon rosae]